MVSPGQPMFRMSVLIPVLRPGFVSMPMATMDFYINDWWIDNIKSCLLPTEGPGPNPCVIGYNFYLTQLPGGTEYLSGFTPDTTYNIPPSQVYYGNQYRACVKSSLWKRLFKRHLRYVLCAFPLASTGCGSCADECAAYITGRNLRLAAKWLTSRYLPANSQLMRNPQPLLLLFLQNTQQMPGNTVLMPSGTIAYGADAFTLDMVDFDVNNVNGWTIIGPSPPSSSFVSGLVYPLVKQHSAMQQIILRQITSGKL